MRKSATGGHVRKGPANFYVAGDFSRVILTRRRNLCWGRTKWARLWERIAYPARGYLSVVVFIRGRNSMRESTKRLRYEAAYLLTAGDFGRFFAWFGIRGIFPTSISQSPKNIAVAFSLSAIVILGGN